MTPITIERSFYPKETFPSSRNVRIEQKGFGAQIYGLKMEDFAKAAQKYLVDLEQEGSIDEWYRVYGQNLLQKLIDSPDMLKGVYPNVFDVPEDKRITITSPRQWNYHCYNAVVFNVGDQIWLDAIPGQNDGQDPIYQTIKGIVKHL